MAHNTCPDCGSPDVSATPYSNHDGIGVTVLCRSCPTVFGFSDKEDFVGWRCSRLRDGPVKRASPITCIETGVSLTCPQCREPLRFTGFVTEPNLPDSGMWVVFVCAEHGNFSLRYGGGLVTGPDP